MKNTIRKIVLLTCLVFLTGGESCVVDQKVIDVVLKEKVCAVFPENSADQEYMTTETVDYAQEIDQILADNDYVRTDIAKLTVEGGAYGVVSLPDGADWEITGSVNVRRVDLGGSPVGLINYASEDLRPLIGMEKPASLNAAGVNLLNDAVEDYLNGSDPVLEFISMGTVDPAPSEQNRIIFEWKAWVLFAVTLQEELDVFDPI